jgi:uncharacterized membrane protein
MNKLSEVLASQSWHLGEAAPGEEVRSQSNINQLITDLKSVIVNNEKYFRICLGALVVIFVGCCAMIYSYRANTLVMTGLFTATGVSFAAIVPQMLSFWREKVRTDTVLILARQLPPGDTMQIIQLLLATGGK